jgi:hypothetical protein
MQAQAPQNGKLRPEVLGDGHPTPFRL